MISFSFATYCQGSSKHFGHSIELLDGEIFDSVAEAGVVIGRYYAEYNYDRRHGAFGMLTPIAFDQPNEHDSSTVMRGA